MSDHGAGVGDCRPDDHVGRQKGIFDALKFKMLKVEVDYVRSHTLEAVTDEPLPCHAHDKELEKLVHVAEAVKRKEQAAEPSDPLREGIVNL